MKSNTKLLILSLVFTASAGILSAQRYVNQEWSSITGLPLNIHWSSSMIASTGHVITVGNTYTSGQSTNVLLTKYATDGTIIWQVEYDNPDNLEDYGIAVCEDNSGNFYVAGTSFRTSSSSLELTVLKFNASGVNQWAYFFDGSASGDDIPAEIVTDGTNVYVAGGTESTSTASDFVTIKVKNDGSVLWTKYYDHNSLDDVAVEVDINQSGDIIVSGGSADQANLYDMATVKYDASGNVLNVHRSNYNVGIDQPTCFDIDASGNSVIGGYYVPAPGEMKISIISLDDTLGLNWSILHDPTSGEDKITGLATDASGNIYVTGHVEESPGYFKCYTAKFDNSGNLIWERDYQSPSGGAFGKTIALSTNGDVNVAGMNYDVGNDTNIIMLIYKPDGTLTTSKEYDAGGTEIASNLEADYWGNIYIHGTSSSNGNGYVTVKYSTFDRPFNVSSNSTYNVDFLDNEILVQFKPQATKPGPFSDKGKTFGQLGDFVTSNAITALNGKFDNQFEFSRFNAVKVFRQMTLADSMSITRLGDTIRMHHFWSTLAIEIPSSLDEFIASDSLNDLDTVVYHCEPNLVGELADIPNDTHFANGDQEGLESSNSPENDINMDDAWDYHTGSEYTRVGVFDSGIDFDHEDFSKTGQLTYSDSKINGGYDFWNDSPVPSGDGDDAGHGTSAAGIIGAIRNNDLGVASVAGGDETQSNYGCQLVDFRIFNENISFGGQQTAVDKAAEGMVEGSRDWGEGGYALDVMNNSWSIKPGNSLFTTSNKSLMFKTNQSVYNNETVNVCSRGNEQGYDDAYPATAGPDQFLISVGASGDNGNATSFSMLGKNIDVVAPGTSSLVYSTTAYWGSVQQKYESFAGTSAAAPHASGVAALLTSQANHPASWPHHHLAPEDVEFLMQKYATDVSDSAYDDSTGHGRLNAGLIMEYMEWPYYWVQHFDGASVESLLDFESAMLGVQLEITDDFFYGTNNPHNINAGSYIGNVWKTEIVATHNIGSAQLIDGWIRNGSANSNLYAPDTLDIHNVPQAVLDSVTTTKAYIHGWAFQILTDAQGNPVNKWIAPDTAAIQFSYSLHLYDTNATGIEDRTETKTSDNFQVWPNPANSEQVVMIPPGNHVDLRIVDIHGRNVKQVYRGDVKDPKRIDVPISDLPSGVYFYRFTSEKNAFSYKFIKI